MIWRIEVANKPGIRDSHGERIKKDIEDLGLIGVETVKTVQVYLLEGDINEADVRKIAESLFTDRITQDYSINRSVYAKSEASFFTVEVAHNPGVMDPVEESALKGIRDLDIEKVSTVRTATKFLIKGRLDRGDIRYIGEKLLYNKLIQHIVQEPFRVMLTKDILGYKFELIHIPLLNMNDSKLARLSKERQLFLNLEEMRAIKDYFSKLRREPTDCELETIAQTWSEHCKHKTLRGLIEYKSEIRNSKSETDLKSYTSNSKIQTILIDNLLKETVMKVTEELKKPWCVSVFKDNSGVIRFDKEYNVCFKVETHNHPSALEPYGGAGTGIGGVIRDPLGTGRGAKPVANTDVFCFAPPDYPYKDLPRGVLHPKRIMKGVVGGVRDYGNRMGIPTVNGAVLFDERFLGNPLVFCGNVGILPRDKSTKRVDTGDILVLVGGRTGRDGIHGATFSSAELTVESEEISSSAVQIGNPIMEKKMVDTILKARDEGLYKAITDCGGGGLSSAAGEMGEETGVEVYLEKVPLKYKGLSYTEIWISESQERMILAVEPKKLKRLLEVFSSEDVEATVIGKFTGDKRLRLIYNDNIVADLDMEFLHHGLPKLKRMAVWEPPNYKEPQFNPPKDLRPALKRILSSWNVASKEWIIRQYDHEVQGGSVLKPLQGVRSDGPGDASIIKPILSSKRGIIISNGINPRYGYIDPYHMAASAIDEALRQIVSVGGDLRRVAILDNFCWGNTDRPKQLGALVRAAFACYDIAKAYGVPFISGKDSLNNEYTFDGKTIIIPPTLLISALAVMPDVTKAVSMDFKRDGNLIYIIGLTRDELGGSHYYYINGYMGNNVPKVDARLGRKIMNNITRAIRRGYVASCHDCSEGGLGVSVSEMAFSGEYGAVVNLKSVPREKGLQRNDKIFFSESNTRFIVEVPKEYKKGFERTVENLPYGLIGETTRSKRLIVYGIDNKRLLDEEIYTLKKAWQKPFSTY